MKKKNIFVILPIVFILSVVFTLTSCGQHKHDESKPTSDESQISYYTCGMHPDVKVSLEEYNRGNKSCPICNMNLTPVHKGKQSESKAQYYGCGMEGAEHVFLIKDAEGMTTCPICGMDLIKLSKEEAERLKGVVSKVKIKGEQIRLAGVRTEPIGEIHLYKEIRTVGRVAYDPGLAIAQQEFITSLKALDKIQQGNVEEINERASNLVESSKRKLKLLGLSAEQIVELEKKREVQTNLILPEEKMWIYGDVYEYELGWLKVGEKVKIATSSFPGEEFHGIVTSINPVLDARTRSVRFRAEVDNPGLKLKPEMYVDVIIMSMYAGREGEKEVLAIPKDAVLDTGMRKIVWIDKGDQEYEGRVIEIGPESTGVIDGQESKFYPVLKGIRKGETVVTKANFLIDSQSQISGVAAAAYGGAVGVEEKKAPMSHQH
ncbi:efflux RND transporter periplasmic adaptor subunit [Candidatus Omnitrophota bacterium]